MSADWLAEVDEAVERGAVKKADTIEELADMLLLDRDVLVRAVKEYNELCEKGVDDEMSTPYDPSWLHPVVKPPFYGAIIGSQMAKTMCGLRTDEHLQVMREDGSLIEGLYANATTAGGLSGEANYGCFWNSTVFGGVGTSWITVGRPVKTWARRSGSGVPFCCQRRAPLRTKLISLSASGFASVSR